MLPGKKYKPEDLIRLVWRRKWTVIVPFVVISACTFVAALMIPNRFRSETVILLVQQRVPDSYVRSTVITRTQILDRLRSIQQQFLSRTRLESIIRDFDLYPSERTHLPMEDIVERMRRDVVVTIVQGEAFRVAYTSDDPKKAMQVVERLASDVTTENLQDREVLATATTDFLQSQLEDARRRLAEQETKVADFQRRHAGRAAVRARGESAGPAQPAIAGPGPSGLDQPRPGPAVVAGADAGGSGSHVPAAPLIVPSTPAGTAVDAVGGVTPAERLEAARDALKALELRLTPEHPDVVYTKRLIVDLEAKVKAEAAQQDPAASRPVRARTAEEANILRRIQENSAGTERCGDCAGLEAERGKAAARSDRGGSDPRLRHAQARGRVDRADARL